MARTGAALGCLHLPTKGWAYPALLLYETRVPWALISLPCPECVFPIPVLSRSNPSFQTCLLLGASSDPRMGYGLLPAPPAPTSPSAMTLTTLQCQHLQTPLSPPGQGPIFPLLPSLPLLT